MNRLEENLNGNGHIDEEKLFNLSGGDKNIFPLMCMASIEPVRLKQNNLMHLNPLNLQLLFSQRFALHFFVFKKEETGLNLITLIVTSLNTLLPPEFASAPFEDINSEEAKNFFVRPLSKFENFKKAILLFEKKSYSFEEFENTIADWKKSLEELIK